MRSGYYVPEFNREACIECGTCADICPPKALGSGPRPELDFDACLGCGLCAVHCPSDAVTMHNKREVERIEERPNPVEWVALWAYVFGFMIPMVFLYSIFTGRKTKEFGKLAKK
jgi:formate hydrogenlyase subunit 6/NADH:ubiquinone oxidoreductase subunit I